MEIKRGRPATGRRYKTSSVQMEPEQWAEVATIAAAQSRSIAFVVRDLITQALSSSPPSGCGSGCTCGK